MKKQFLFNASLLLILGIYGLWITDESFAQSQTDSQNLDSQTNQTKAIPENIAYAQLFRIINSFEKEAAKQESQGYADRAKILRNTFQKKLGLTDKQFAELKETSSNFSGQLSRLKLKAKKIKAFKKSQARKNGEVEKIEGQYNQLPLIYRESLRKVFGAQDFELFAKSFQEKIAAKMSYRFDEQSRLLFIGYSTITYNSAGGEIIGYSTTPNDGAGCDEEYPICIGTGVYATLSGDEEGVLDSDSSETCNVDSDVFLYYSGSLPEVRYCVDASHLYDDSSFCGFQGGGSTSTSSDCLITPPLPNVTGVTFQTIALNNLPIDANPNIGGGLRLFPDDNTPMENANRQMIQVTAGISEPVAGRMVYFRNFDIDDPSDDTIIDPMGNAGNDNNGSVNGLREGQLSAVSATTNSNGIATVNFTVTMQPGDNFAIAASTSDTEINSVDVSGAELVNGNSQNIPITCDDDEPVCRSEMLTVWRRLHIEVDSMGISQENFVLGTIANLTKIKANQMRTINLNPTTPVTQLEPNRFEGGRLGMCKK